MHPRPPGPFTFTPNRRTQPYRNTGQRHPGPALQAMLNGRTLFGQNPMDQQRHFQQLMPTPREGGLLWHLLRQQPPYPYR